MQRYTDARGPDTADELWLVEHEPVFTLGQAGKPEHVLAAGDIPVLAVDRGGQAGDIGRIDQDTGVTGDLRGGGARRGHDRSALGHGLEDREPEALLAARVAEDVGTGMECPKRVGVDEPHCTHPITEAVGWT